MVDENEFVVDEATTMRDAKHIFGLQQLFGTARHKSYIELYRSWVIADKPSYGRVKVLHKEAKGAQEDVRPGVLHVER